MSVSSVSTSSSALLEQLQARLDRDRSGGVGKDEIQSATTSRTGRTSSTDVAALFRSADTDGDALLSKSEVKSAFDSLSSEMRSQLLGLQETGSSARSDAAEPPPSPPPPPEAREEADGPRGPGGPGGPGGPAGPRVAEIEDPADTDGDGAVSPNEQASYDEADATSATTTEADSATAADDSRTDTAVTMAATSAPTGAGETRDTDGSTKEASRTKSSTST
ncbi:hypothetical protein [Rhodoplanes azumiensis]|uniref:EF-hand domain-containing protein n=1 Tax=Rhodoplanes azumiensis TaxID=1897628 RepID=A0ABW5AL15_9BRAD